MFVMRRIFLSIKFYQGDMYTQFMGAHLLINITGKKGTVFKHFKEAD